VGGFFVGELVQLAGIGPSSLHHQAPLLTFDGTLFSDMGF
jgi:hypothetical protein